MTCYHPLTAWQLEGGEIVFAERGRVRRQVTLPCGRCIGCRIKRTRAWAIRCVHESKCHDVSSFVTLTYDDNNYCVSLNYRDIQLFLYRLRKRFGSGIRYFVAGEYGSINLRPHWHLLLFGVSFSDGVKCGESIYSSRVLDGLWRVGFSSFGGVTYQSAAYCAKYACKRVTGDRAKAHYSRVNLCTGEIVDVVPEFARMSLRPGLGYNWFVKYWRDVYLARDGICQEGGYVVPAPRYYDKLLSLLPSDGRGNTGDDLLVEKQFDRYVSSGKFAEDCTPERLFSRELCALANESRRRSVL